ncbi:MAG: glycosyltransferase family 2 protein [Erysipelotrichaceae bacterium]|nr:glycosyltransferase family 2 protein [Erysipelotrichaceae bacterium]
MPAVSVIMPVYNAERYLQQSIGSVLGQSFQDWELILVNDGSKDSSEEICRNYAGQDHRIIVLSQKNAGPNKAVLNGLMHAASEYVMFLDADDWYDSEMIRILYQSAVFHQADAVMGGYQKVSPDGVLLERPLTTPDAVYEKEDIEQQILKPFYETEADIYRRWSAPRWDKVYRTSVLKKAFEDVDITMSLGEDLAMNLSFLHYADRVVTLKGCWLYNYRVLDKSAAHGYSEALEKKNQSLAINIDILAVKQGYTFTARPLMEDNNTLGLLFDLSQTRGLSWRQKAAIRRRLIGRLHNKGKAAKVLLYKDFPGKAVLQKLYRRIRDR